MNNRNLIQALNKVMVFAFVIITKCSQGSPPPPANGTKLKSEKKKGGYHFYMIAVSRVSTAECEISEASSNSDLTVCVHFLRKAISSPFLRVK